MTRIALAFVLWLACVAAFASEQRLALVIGNAGYRVDPLDNPVNDARLVASSLKQAGFDVTLAENLDRRGLLGTLRAFGERLNDDTVAVLYYAGHGLQLRDRNYLIPVDAEIRSEDEIPLAGIDLSFILARMSAAKSRINIVVLDACRNNPFASSSGKGSQSAQGLAPMDAPVGTLLAYATAPGKLAADGLGGVNDKNGLYAQHLARQVLTPGLPVEHVFKRVREAVVRASREAQVPWESSSLQGEFSFVPGAALARDGAEDRDAAAELAFWNSVQATSRADDLRAYLRQYPRGRFTALAQSRLDASASPAPPLLVASVHNDKLPRVGDSWRYRVQDQFRLGDLFVTAKVEAVNAQGIAESRTTSAEATPRSARVALDAAFSATPDASLAPPEFAPYLQVAGLIGPALRGTELSQQIEQASVPLRVSLEGDEDVQVAAGKFHAQKVVLRGQAQARGAARSGVVITEHRLWYASEVKRVIKHEITTTVGGALRQSTSVELVEYSVR
jgi:Caspase domain